MTEKKYLITLQQWTVGGSRSVRFTALKTAGAAIIAVLLVSLLTKYTGLLASNDWFLILGIIAGVTISKLTNILNAQYLLNHLNTSTIEQRIRELE